MDEETKELLANLSASISSLVERQDSMAKRVEEIGNAAEEARQRAVEVAGNSRATLARRRLDSLVQGGRVTPHLRSALESLISEEADEEKLDAFFEQLEQLPRLGSGSAAAEITTSDGKREVVDISARHQTPDGKSGVDPVRLAIFHQCMAEANSFAEFEKLASQAINGPQRAGALGPLFQN